MLKSEIQSLEVFFCKKPVVCLIPIFCVWTSQLWAEPNVNTPEDTSLYDDTGHLVRGEGSYALSVEQVAEDNSKLKSTFRKAAVAPQCQALADRGVIKSSDLQIGPPDKFRFAGELLHENDTVIKTRLSDAQVSLDPTMLNSCLSGLRSGASGMVGVLIKEPKTAVTEGLELRQKIYEGSLKACENMHKKDLKNLSGEEVNLVGMCKEIVKYGFSSVLETPEVTGNLILTEFSMKTATSIINFFRGLSRGGKSKKAQKFVTQFMQNMGQKVKGFECVTAEAQTRAVCEGLSAAVVLGGSVVLGSLTGVCEEECPAEILEVLGRAESAGDAAAAASLAGKVQGVERTAEMVMAGNATKELAAVARAPKSPIPRGVPSPQSPRPTVQATIIPRVSVVAASRSPASVEAAADLNPWGSEAIHWSKEAAHIFSELKHYAEFYSQEESGSALMARAKSRNHLMEAGLQAEVQKSQVSPQQLALEQSLWAQITKNIDQHSEILKASLSKGQSEQVQLARLNLFNALIQGARHFLRTGNKAEFEDWQIKTAKLSPLDRALFRNTQLKTFLEGIQQKQLGDRG
jgi:hypothetical protein